MNFNSRSDLEENGFNGFLTINELWEDKSHIPKEKGIYLVLNPNFAETRYVFPGVGGFYNGKDPNISIDELQLNYIPDSLVIYIGKAGSPSGGATLNSRLGQFLRFGRTRDVAFWEGRFIWQIENPGELLICWKPTPNEDPREIKRQYLEEYIASFGNKPFAN